MYKIAKENLSALFQAIAGEQELYVPVNNNGQVNFAAWTEGANVDLDTLKTVKSPKDAFFPQSENLYTVKTEDKKYFITSNIIFLSYLYLDITCSKLSSLSVLYSEIEYFDSINFIFCASSLKFL